jgi:glycosyltransferase involved in cell wall biosynthesis
LALSILYLHPIGAFGGASRSLLEALRAFPVGEVRPRVIAPRGRAATVLEQEGYSVVKVLGVSQFDCTRFGHYHGLRWLILLREVFYVPFIVWGLLKARRMWRDIDLIHANEITALLPALLAKKIFRKPLVVHVRSVQQTEGIPLRRRWLLSLLRRYADAVIAIDQTVRASLPADLDVEIVHNAFAPDLHGETPQAVAEAERRFHTESLRVGMVGNLLALKGVYDFLEAARLCIAANANMDFVIVGSNPRKLSGLRGALLARLGFARDVEADMARFIEKQRLEARVHRIAFTPEISAVYRSLDVLCFPSHLDAVGRPVLEAAWFGVPSVVAVDRPSPDTLIEGKTGLQVPARNPQALAQALLRLAEDRNGLRQMGEAARRLAERNFDGHKNALQMLEVYRRVLGEHRQAGKVERKDDTAA